MISVCHGPHRPFQPWLTKADAQQVEDDLPQKVDEAMRFLTTDAIDFTLMV